MFTTLLLSICCFSLVISSSIDQHSNEKYIDGKQYHIKSVDTTYTQRVTNHGQCMVELNSEDEKTNSITEGEIVQIKNKWFKVEDCRLNRAYVAPCGSPLLREMRNVVCSYIEHHYGKKILKRRQTTEDLISILDRSYYGICCQSACTISELAQYCPTKW